MYRYAMNLLAHIQAPCYDVYKRMSQPVLTSILFHDVTFNEDIKWVLFLMCSSKVDAAGKL